MPNLIELHDIVQINPEPALTKLSKDAKIRLMDSVLQKADSEAKRGLRIDFNLSSSGRRINNRIYTPQGQKAGLDTWLEPYPKPIIRNHDREGDPLGRFTDVQWVSNQDQAIRFFDTAADWMALQDAFASDQPRKIYKTLKKHGLLTNKKWPGVGALHASALITDEDAVEKFLDGRYLTFSAGTHTDRYVCGICGDDWAQGDICEHAPGRVTEDGDIGTFITGIFHGDEGSVLTMPANGFSQVHSMQFADGAEFNQRTIDWRGTDESTIYITDADLGSWEPDMPTKETETSPTAEDSTPKFTELDPRDFARALVEDTLSTEMKDALKGMSHLEIQWLVRAHDALHFEFDYYLRASETAEDPDAVMDRIPRDVFRFHGDLHDLSMQKDFRGSLINGPLDGYDSKGVSSTEYMLKRPSTDEEETEEMKLKDVEALVTKVLKRLIAESLEDSTTDQEEAHEDTEQSDVAGVSEATEEVQEEVQEDEVATESVTDEAPASEEAQTDEQTDEASTETETETETTDSEDSDDCSTCGEADGLDIDWAMLDLALQAEVQRMADESPEDGILQDAKLSTEQRKKLKSSTFCGPDRSFPVPDCAHVTAARRLIGRAKLSDAQKARVLSCVNGKAKKLGCDKDGDGVQEIAACNCDSLKEDYAQALRTIDEFKVKVESLEQKLADNEGTRVNIADVSEETTNSTPKITSVENPSVDSSDPKADTATTRAQDSTLGSFEKKVLERYKLIRDERGETEADAYIRYKKSRGHLKRSFDAKKLIEEF